jgi:REP element-mobilizing transposase RayT
MQEEHSSRNDYEQKEVDLFPVFFNPDLEIDIRRHWLPHWQQGHTWIFVTWRLADSLPESLLTTWRTDRSMWLKWHPKPWDQETAREYHKRFSHQIECWLDEGLGSCLLKDQENAAIVANALRHFHDDRYLLRSFVIMPNHVHVLFRPGKPHALSKIVKSWKGYTAKRLNQKLGRSGNLWQREYWDRLIRDENHLQHVLDYIRLNPVKAKLKEGNYILE